MLQKLNLFLFQRLDCLVGQQANPYQNVMKIPVDLAERAERIEELRHNGQFAIRNTDYFSLPFVVPTLIYLFRLKSLSAGSFQKCLHGFPARAQTGNWELQLVLHRGGGPAQLLETSLLPLRVCMSRMLESGVEPGFKFIIWMWNMVVLTVKAITRVGGTH